jgi:hypothetical protein
MMPDTTIKLSKKYSELLEKLLELEKLNSEWRDVKPKHIKSKKAFIEYLIATYIYDNNYHKSEELNKLLV